MLQMVIWGVWKYRMPMFISRAWSCKLSMMSGIYGSACCYGSFRTHFWSQHMYLQKMFKIGNIQALFAPCFCAKFLVVNCNN